VSSSPIFHGAGGASGSFGTASGGRNIQTKSGLVQMVAGSVPIQSSSRPLRSISSASLSQEGDFIQSAYSSAQSFPGQPVNSDAHLELSRHLDQLERRKKRRESHNAVERRRRDLINDKIKELASIVPDCVNEDRLNKGTILVKTVDYIRALQDANKELNDRLNQTG
jgi:hypothetical protein